MRKQKNKWKKDGREEINPYTLQIEEELFWKNK
jgi:hypothetical protein